MVPGRRGDTVVPQCSEGCCDIIPSRGVYRDDQREPRKSWLRTHAHARVRARARPRPGAHRATPVQPESKHLGVGAAQRDMELLARSTRFSHGHVHAPAGTRAESPLEVRPVGGRFDVAAAPLLSPFRIPLYTFRAPLFLSLLSSSAATYRSISLQSYISLSLSFSARFLLLYVRTYVCTCSFHDLPCRG